MLRKLVITALAAIVSIGVSIGAARAQDGDGYPSRPIRLIVPFAAGGGTDTLSRIFGQVLSEQLKGTVVIENNGGAGGTIGIGQAAKAAPDGYTLLSATPSITINPHIQKNVPYDMLRDFVPVVQITTSPAVLVVNKDFPVRSVRDLIELARGKPGSISYGSAGIGSFAFLAAELFKALAGVDLTHIPYRGTGPALIDLMAGRIQVEFENAPAVLGQIRNGELRAIAVGTAKTLDHPARPADHRRHRARLRVELLARPPRAGRHAAADHRQAQRRHQQGARRPGHPPAAERSRRRARRRHARSVRRLPQSQGRGDRQGRQGRRAEGGVAWFSIDGHQGQPARRSYTPHAVHPGVTPLSLNSAAASGVFR